jgi:hypothetical protein
VVAKSAKSGAAVVLYPQFDLPYSNSYIIDAITMISMFLTLDRLVMTNVLILDAKVNATNANAFIINANAFGAITIVKRNEAIISEVITN